MKYFITIYIFLLSHFAHAQSLRAPIEKVGNELLSLASAVGLIGLAICGIHFIVGSQDASQKASKNFIGLLLISMATTIIGFFTSLR